MYARIWIAVRVITTRNRWRRWRGVLYGNTASVPPQLVSLLNPPLNHSMHSVCMCVRSGYGMSEGRPSERRMYSDANCAWEALRMRCGVRPEQVVLYGQYAPSLYCIYASIVYTRTPYTVCHLSSTSDSHLSRDSFRSPACNELYCSHWTWTRVLRAQIPTHINLVFISMN